ncbi:MAG: Holliday junction branch migration protein RuvA [Chthonomonas sp.]|nr:Holliday junction branch migration protein RuvA [Chthonomonas sp.]
MIARLRGTVWEMNPPHLVVDVQGVGYELLAPEPVLLQLGVVGLPVDLFVRQIFREDGTTLYAFANADQRRCFDILTGVSGCGPKIALAALGTLGEQGVVAAIVDEDIPTLIKTPGIGAKLAERISRELREKMREELWARHATTPKPTKEVSSPVDDELVDALMNLGYRRAEADLAAATARDEATGLEDQLRAALRHLRK